MCSLWLEFSTSERPLSESGRFTQKIYEVGCSNGHPVLIRTKKNHFFLGGITLLSDNIFRHDFFCTTTTHHETFIFEVFRLQNAWWRGLRRVAPVSKPEICSKHQLSKYQLESIWCIFRDWNQVSPSQTPPPRILQLKNLKNERFVMRSCGTKKIVPKNIV